MANDIKAAITPGIINDPSEVLTLRFTAPKDATDVVIKVMELDTWSVDGRTVREPNGKDDLRAEIKGTLAQGKFTVANVKADLPPVNGKPQPAIKLKLDLDGKQVEIPFSSLEGQKENGFFEVHFEITGTVAGKPAGKYVSRAPVSFRTLPAGPELAFISGEIDDFEEPYTKEYFPQAAKFYAPLKDNLIQDRKELTRILSFLGGHQDIRGNKPWGRVNIVAHGTENFWAIRTSSASIGPDFLDAAETRRLTSNSSFAPPGPNDLTDQSQIVIRACEVGNDQDLLNEIKGLFGGRAKVFAPLLLLSYREENGIPKEALVALPTIFLPGSRTSFPSAAEAKAAMIKRYRRTSKPTEPDITKSPYRNFTDAQFAEAAAITSTDKTQDNFREKTELIHFLNRPRDPNDPGFTLEDISIVKDGRIVRRKTNDELTKELDFLRIPGSSSTYDEHKWKWEARPRQKANPDDPDEFDLHGTGTTTRVEYFMLLKTEIDGVKVPVVPDLNNPNHFGQSN